MAQYFPSAYGTLGGILINSNLEVLTPASAVISGLYSAGTDACTIYGDSYMLLLPGNPMGFSINKGRIRLWGDPLILRLQNKFNGGRRVHFWIDIALA
ncbi:hypothetical protein FACS189493_0720 [Spirochaetia bacterium]|nr:hypothetical protein FACS189493_0720 [Spirochaetia bacterium]